MKKKRRPKTELEDEILLKSMKEGLRSGLADAATVLRRLRNGSDKSDK